MKESSLESMQGVYPDRESGYTIGGHPTPCCHHFIPDCRQVAPGCCHFIPGCRHLHPDARRHFAPGCRHLHPIAAHFPPQMFTSGILMPDGKGERFNFSGYTYPDHLIASTRMGEQPFCTVLRCSPEASRYLRPTLWDILL